MNIQRTSSTSHQRAQSINPKPKAEESMFDNHWAESGASALGAFCGGSLGVLAGELGESLGGTTGRLVAGVGVSLAYGAMGVGQANRTIANTDTYLSPDEKSSRRLLTGFAFGVPALMGGLAGQPGALAAAGFGALLPVLDRQFKRD